MSARNYVGQFCLGRGVKYFDFRGRSPRYGSGRLRLWRAFYSNHNKGRLKTVISGLLSRNPYFQTTSVMMGIGGVGFAHEKYIGLFCFGRWAKYPDFCGRSPRYGCGGYFIQTRIEGRLKTVITGLPGCNPWFQTTSTKMGQGSVGFAREKLCWLILFGMRGKISDFCGRSPCYGCGRCFIQTHNKGCLKMRIASFSKTTISFSDDLLCIWIFNQTAKSAATQSQSRPATCFVAAVL